MIKSVYEDQRQILAAIRLLHCPAGFDLDATYGNGMFYKGLEPPRLRFDLTPQVEGVIKADSRMLPIDGLSVDSFVFDPPFLTYIKGGRDHNGGGMRMAKRFGGYYKYSELVEHYHETISEAYRVLRANGKLIVKCQDIIHNHKILATHVKTIQLAEIEGFRLLDLFILAATHRMPRPQGGEQKHARIFHSYFLVFQKLGGSKKQGGA